MACAQKSATEYLKENRSKLVTHMRNLPLIVENLYQQKVFDDHDVDSVKAETTEFDKARFILDQVIKKGKEASYELLKILDVTQKRTLHPDLHSWICCFPIRLEDAEASYSFGTNSCQNYQAMLKKKAKSILMDRREHCSKYLDDKAQANVHFIPVVLETDSVVKTPQCKIKLKSKKCKKLRPKKLRAYIPNEQRTLSPVDLLKAQDKNILLIGKPGIGKTTVVQEIMRLWAEKEDRQWYYMFYFDESVLAHSSRVANLESFLFDVYLKPMDKDRKEVFQDIEENSENVVIVFDGIVDLERNSVIWKIMNHELLSDAKIVITCRSEVEYDPLFSDWPTWKVYVQGFSEESINTFYQNTLSDDRDVVLKNQELFSLSHVPMYAFMIADLIRFENDNVFNHPHSVTEMYIHIFRAAVKKHGKKKNKQIDGYLKETKDQLHLLMEKAFSATRQKNLNLPDVSIDETDICHAFLKMITTRDSPTSATTYCAFLHNTMQEFFSAFWLFGHPDEIEKVLKLCQTEEHKHMRHVLPFLCGLLGEHNIKHIKCLFTEDQIKKTSEWFIEKLLDTFLQPESESEEFDLLYVCQCLYELQSPKACLMFLEKMNHHLEPEVDLDPHQCCALAYVIGQSRDREVYLNLKDCNMTDAGMNMMLSCSPKIRLKICEEPLKQITFFLEFFHKASQCSCDVRINYKQDQLNALLDLCSHVKNYETQTGRSFLPALQPIYQSVSDVWRIKLSERKISILIEVLKLQTEKKPVDLMDWTDEESEVREFLQCLPYISELRFNVCLFDDEKQKTAVQFLVNLSVAALERDEATGESFNVPLISVCSYTSFPSGSNDCNNCHHGCYEECQTKRCDFLLDLYSHMKNSETQTGRSFLPALQPIYQSVPDVWRIKLSERKISILLEVLKLQTEKKPVDLMDWTDEESEVRGFLQCLPHISQLRLPLSQNEHLKVNDWRLRLTVLDMCLQVPAIKNEITKTSVDTLYDYIYHGNCDFMLDLYSHMKVYATQTGRSVLPVLQVIFQSAPAVWRIKLSERNISILLEVLKLQTEKKPVDLMDWTNEESEVRGLLQCLPYISQFRFVEPQNKSSESWEERKRLFIQYLYVQAAINQRQTIEETVKKLLSSGNYKRHDFLLGLCSHVKNYETQKGRSFLPALQSIYQSVPAVWFIDLSERKSSILLEVLKLQTEKKPVDLMDWTDEESEVRGFLQCLPHISQLRSEFYGNVTLIIPLFQ